MATQHLYTLVRQGYDDTGIFKYWLRRDDGRATAVKLSKFIKLVGTGKVKGSNQFKAKKS